MADIRLVEFVLFECDFEMRAERSGDPASEPTDAPEDNADELESDKPDESYFEYPSGDFLELEHRAFADGDDYVLIIDATLDTPQLPFRLSITVGARFYVPSDANAGRPAVEEAAGTLVFLCYPYLRETISGITGRSPVPPYMIPPLTKLPHPSVTGEPEPDATE